MIVASVIAAPHPPAALWFGLALALATVLGGLGAGPSSGPWCRVFSPGSFHCSLPRWPCASEWGAVSTTALPSASTACLISGVGAGAVIARLSHRVTRGRRTFLLVAGGLGTLVGSMTCLQFGVVGLGLLALGYAASVVPSWVAAQVTPSPS